MMNWAHRQMTTVTANTARFEVSSAALTKLCFLLGRGLSTRTEIREALSGNFCRCTGYHAIVDAIEVVARRRGIPS